LSQYLKKRELPYAGVGGLFINMAELPKMGTRKMRTPRKRSVFSAIVAMCLFVCGLFPGTASLSAAGGGVKLDGTLGPKGPVASGTLPDGTRTTYLITDTLGKKAGGNLFFSFGQFNIYTGESATFTSASNALYRNIIGRVTGGGPSSIDGLLRSTIDGANLFLMNPNGVMFGPNATLDVKGSFHVTTADYIKFANGDSFYANPSANSVLSVAKPEAFGFLTANPAAISLDRSILKVPTGRTLSVVGGDIQVTNDPSLPSYYDYDNYVPGSTYYSLSAPEGKINLLSAASPGIVKLNTSEQGMAAFSQGGSISLTNGANITVSSADYTTPAGSVAIRGGQIVINGSNFDASGDPGGTFDIRGGTLQVDGSYLMADSMGAVKHPGRALDIRLSGDLLMTNASLFDSSSFGSEKAGDIFIRANNIKLGDDTPGTGRYADAGFYGAITSTSTGAGRGGNVLLRAVNLTVQNGFYVNSATFGTATAGDVSVVADSIKCLDQGSISSNGFGAEGSKGGMVDVRAHNILISATNEVAVINSHSSTGIAAQADSASDGGAIRLRADNLQLLDGGKIDTILWGAGHGADVTVSAKNIGISGIVSDSYYNSPSAPGYMAAAIDGRVYGANATGMGGNISVRTNHLSIADGGAIRTALFWDDAGGIPSGTAGNINVNAGRVAISNRGQIYADSFRGTGDSGDINMSAGSLSITGVGSAPTPSPIVSDFTGLSTTTSTGRGGAINVALTGDLLLNSRGGINAETQGTGLGGAINIGAHNALLSGESTISAATSGAGKAGNISISARNLFKMDNSLVTTAADFAQGGDINLLAQDIKLRNGAVISAESSGAGNAGDIGLTASNLFESRDSAVTTEAKAADGGNVRINMGYMLRLINSKITTSVGGGPQTVGGNIDTNSEYVILQNSRVVANAYEGRGGNIGIDAGTYLADPSSIVDASSALGIDGTVDIRAVVQTISGVVQPLPKNFISAADLLRNPCEARLKGDKAGSLVVRGRDGLPIEPGGFLPSPM
jgi:filamentous hemagglutinin family protein